MKRLIVILGPTAVGKTDYSIEVARHYGSPIISCDSRQIYREMRIGTAVPSPDQLAAVKHYFIRSHSVTEPYTAGKYEIEALRLIHRLFDEGHDTLVMCGGSGFYIDAVCNGLDDFPEADPELRRQLNARLTSEGVESLRLDLRRLDPESYATIDIANGQRVIRALEVCLMTGRPFSSFKTSPCRQRDFAIEKIGLTRPREELYARINSRVYGMVKAGLVEEVRSLLPFRELTALQTVGYREIFAWFDYMATTSAPDNYDTTMTARPGSPAAQPQQQRGEHRGGGDDKSHGGGHRKHEGVVLQQRVEGEPRQSCPQERQLRPEAAGEHGPGRIQEEDGPGQHEPENEDLHRVEGGEEHLGGDVGGAPNQGDDGGQEVAQGQIVFQGDRPFAKTACAGLRARCS